MMSLSVLKGVLWLHSFDKLLTKELLAIEGLEDVLRIIYLTRALG